MGFMTEVSILNDRWGEIREEPKNFVEQIYESSMSNGREPSYVIGQTTVAKTHHADVLRVYYAAGNSFFDAHPQDDFDLRRLEMHLHFIADMQTYLSACEWETRQRLKKAKAK